jgi:hypothetical protein
MLPADRTALRNFLFLSCLYSSTSRVILINFFLINLASISSRLQGMSNVRRIISHESVLIQDTSIHILDGK